mmetsp:Transcript_31517/g.46002  ORF Transcript_31517/g.46002 Transcript_31517/m.46002 type:complete len:117 (-) Transcript_31517:800-1150(-)
MNTFVTSLLVLFCTQSRVDGRQSNQHVAFVPTGAFRSKGFLPKTELKSAISPLHFQSTPVDAFPLSPSSGHSIDDMIECAESGECSIDDLQSMAKGTNKIGCLTYLTFMRILFFLY